MTAKKRQPVIRRGKSPKRVKSLMRKYIGHADSDRNTKIRFRGKYSGLGQQAFLYQLFEENEKAGKDQKLTNFALQEIISREFPHNYAVLYGFKTGNKTVNYYRHHYNLGEYSQPKWQPPLKLSYRYNEYGIIVDTRTGKKPLSVLDRERYARKYFGAYTAGRVKKETEHEQPTSFPAVP